MSDKTIRFSALLHEAWISIGASRLRTFLAMLGIVIGVGSVVLMLAIGTGSKRVVEENIAKLGSNLLIITPGGTSHKGLRSAGFSSFEFKDVDAISQIPTVITTAPATFSRSFQVSSGKPNWNTQVTGSTPDYFIVTNWGFEAGASFTADDVRLIKRSAVIGSLIAEKIFPDMNPEDIIGRTLRINTTSFTVAGILKHKGSGFDGRNQDDAVIIPITTAKSTLWGNDYIDGLAQMVYVQAISAERMDEATDAIADVLRQRRKIHATHDDDFNIRNLTAVMQTAADTTQAFSLLLGAIASISLIVGGIGIMNIMLVTVTERTREIGIRKAIGATERQILLQFLLEAIMIACVGSLAGLIIGFACGITAQTWFGINADFTISIAFMVIAVALITGIASGLYPAYKAARLQPIEALRSV